MRTIEEVRQRLLDNIAHAAERPSMWCWDEHSAQLTFLQLLGDICYIDERESELRQARFALERRELVRTQGVGDGFRRRFPEQTDLMEEVVSVYAEVAYDLGYLTLPRLLSEAEWKSLTNGLRGKCRTQDFTLSETLATFGPPTLQVGGCYGPTLCYAPLSRESRWIFFDFCSCHWELAKKSGRDPYEADPILRNARIPATVFWRELTLTPHGRQCPEAGGADRH